MATIVCVVGSQQTGDSNIEDPSVVTVIDCGTQVIKKTSKKDRKLEFYVKAGNLEILTVRKAIRKNSKKFKITCDLLCSSGWIEPVCWLNLACRPTPHDLCFIICSKFHILMSSIPSLPFPGDGYWDSLYCLEKTSACNQYLDLVLWPHLDSGSKYIKIQRSAQNLYIFIGFPSQDPGHNFMPLHTYV